MELILQQCDLLNSESLFMDDFDNNLKGWEVTRNMEEQAFMKDSYYWMENTDKSNWKYYKMKMPLKRKDDFIIDTKIEILSKDEYGHVGLVWGFNKDREVLNRFSVSADGERFVVMHFQKDHHQVYHRFHYREPNPVKTDVVRLSIVKISGYFYFLLNSKLVYTCHATHFADYGPYCGFYVEPGILIRSPYIEVKRLITKPSEANCFINQLLSWQPLV